MANGDNFLDSSGAFGIRGTGRDLLGILGDAFLLQSGNEPMYRQRRMQEREAKAMQGFVDNPLEAISQMTGVNPAAAGKLFDEHQGRGVDRARADSEILARSINTSLNEQEGVRKEQDYQQRGFETISAFLENATPENWPFYRARIQEFANARRLALPWDTPETFDPEWVNAVRSMAVPAKDQRTIEGLQAYRDFTSGIQARGQNLREAEFGFRRDTYEPRAPTEAEEIARIRESVNMGEQLSPGDAATWERYNRPPGRQQRQSSTVPPLDPKQHRGQTVTDKETGTKWRSDGTNWRRAD